MGEIIVLDFAGDYIVKPNRIVTRYHFVVEFAEDEWSDYLVEDLLVAMSETDPIIQYFADHFTDDFVWEILSILIPFFDD